MNGSKDNGLLRALQLNATDDGIIAALAMDQRGSLKRALEGAGATDPGPADLSEFKVHISEVLTEYSTAILLDPGLGLEAARRRRPGSGLLLAYERSGYDSSEPGRQPDLLDGWSVRRLKQQGATGVKLLVYYDPFDDAKVNDKKHAFVERVGAECEAVGLPLFLEPVTYDDSGARSEEIARRKPMRVRETAAEFSKSQYRVAVLKVEYPVDPRFAAGLGAADGAVLYGPEETKDHLLALAEVSRLPVVFLSAGVDMDLFVRMLEFAGEVGMEYHGVLCGRATWKGAIPVYSQQGAGSMRRWLSSEGIRNIRRLRDVVVQSASPWWTKFGGREAALGAR